MRCTVPKFRVLLLVILVVCFVVFWVAPWIRNGADFRLPTHSCHRSFESKPKCNFLNCSQFLRLVSGPIARDLRSRINCQTKDGYCHMENVCFWRGAIYSSKYWFPYDHVHLGRQQASPDSIPANESRVRLARVSSDLFAQPKHYYVDQPSILMVYLWNSYGHLLLDTLFPLVVLMRKISPLTAHHCIPIFTTNEPSRLGEEMLSLVSSHNSIHIPQTEIGGTSTAPVCFRHLLLGTAKKYLYGNGIQGNDVKLVRDHVYQMLNIIPEAPFAAHSTCEVVLLSHFKRAISNVDDVMALLRRVTSWARCNVSTWDPGTLSIVDQPRAFSRISLLVGASSSGMHNAIFLPDHAGYIDLVHPYFFWANSMYCTRSRHHFCTELRTRIAPNVNTAEFYDRNGVFQHQRASTSAMEVPLEVLERKLSFIVAQTRKKATRS